MDWEQGLLLAVVVLQLVIIKALLEVNARIAGALQNMPEILAAAVPGMLNQGLGVENYEPPSPVQAAIAQLILSRAQNPAVSEILERGPGGKFN